MRNNISKSNLDLTLLFARVDEIQMSSYERARAKTHLARADAVAEGVVSIVNIFKRLLSTSAVTSTGHPTKLAG